MKRCPRCNQEFTDEWLTFCTQDGTSLVEVEVSPTDPPPTLLRPPMPPSVSPTEQPTLDMPGRSVPPPAQYIPPPAQYTPRPAGQSGWAPPPPPPYPPPKQTGMAVTSMVLGIASMTLGFCCYFGILTAPVALGLGIVSLVQIKNNPSRNGGKGMAVAGIIMGGLYFVILALIMVFYGIGILLGGMH